MVPPDFLPASSNLAMDQRLNPLGLHHRMACKDAQWTAGESSGELVVNSATVEQRCS
jgi:hypothetical protein